MTSNLYQLTARGEDSGVKTFIRSFLEQYRAEIVAQEYRESAFRALVRTDSDVSTSTLISLRESIPGLSSVELALP